MTEGRGSLEFHPGLPLGWQGPTALAVVATQGVNQWTGDLPWGHLLLLFQAHQRGVGPGNGTAGTAAGCCRRWLKPSHEPQ